MNANLIPTVHVDNFSIEESQIIAYTIVDRKDINFSINHIDFQNWCDLNDLRGEGYTWGEIYAGWTEMERLLKAYIEFIYEAE